MEPSSSSRSVGRAFVVGIGVAILTGAFMIAMTKAGLAPFPKPPSLAFAETVLGRALPLPVGLAFHTAYVTAWSMIFVLMFPRRTILAALLLAAALWIVVLVVFFPIVGWGFLGGGVGPQLIPGAFIPHLVFGLVLWGLNRIIPERSTPDTTG